MSDEQGKTLLQLKEVMRAIGAFKCLYVFVGYRQDAPHCLNKKSQLRGFKQPLKYKEKCKRVHFKPALFTLVSRNSLYITDKMTC